MSDRDVITLKDVYREVVAVSGRMAAIDERQQQGERVDRDHEMRLRALERWRYALPLSLITAAAAAAAALIH